ncbi:MAG: sigma-54-dependent Fis family transcriptional regulator [Gammaproteobacteria bacterium]|nr:sigma-54-dependent Fis family transcriptional regulator [Gammaproteobacteria bacterium]
MPMDTAVLLVDDEALFVRAACKLLKRAGLPSKGSHTLSEARQLLRTTRPGVILLDVRLPDGSGLELLEELAVSGNSPPVIVLTAFGDVEDAVAAMKLGASDYLQKPCDMEQIITLTRKLLANSADKPPRASRDPIKPVRHDIVGKSPCIESLRSQVESIGSLSQRSDAPPPTVLLTGETGVGKGLVARYLHSCSARREAPFVQVDCAALPGELIESELFGHSKGAFTGAHREKAGLIEQAASGTLFLDEIGDVALQLQSKLLAVLDRRQARRVGETREYSTDAWFIAATHHDLDELSVKGSFRKDLLYRLNPLTLHVPSLADRQEDVPLLARYYLRKLLVRYQLTTDFSDAAIQCLMDHSWQGNVRELIGVVERAVYACNGNLIDPVHLGLASKPVASGDRTPQDAGSLQQAEIEMVSRTLRETGGNVSEAARRLGMTRMMLRYRIRKFRISEKSV